MSCSHLRGLEKYEQLVKYRPVLRAELSSEVYEHTADTVW